LTVSTNVTVALRKVSTIT